MAAGWYFAVQDRGARVRDSVQEEFFNTEAIANLAEALIREAIQNSLDAALPNQAVRVRVFVSGAKASVRAEDLKPLLGTLWPHIQAGDSGVADAPRMGDPCPFVVIEDFGTTGLTGDPGEWPGSPDNHFFHFFRAEGRSSKVTTSRGRWGLGKLVFAAASKIRTFVGLTRPQSGDKSLLMGVASLRTHTLDDRLHCPDGWYGTKRGVDQLVYPEEDVAWFAEFSARFHLTRKLESGFSSVILYPREELTFTSLLEAVVRQYFQPIATGDLQVDLETPGRSIALNADTLSAEISRLAVRDRADLLLLSDVSQWAGNVALSDIVHLSEDALGLPPKWGDGVIGPAALEEIRAQLESTGRSIVRIPVRIQANGKKPLSSYFDVVLARDPANSLRPIYIREGIIIPSVSSAQVRGYRTLVLVSDSPLASFLGDSENPSHTEWQEKSSHFKSKYVNGASLLRFVRRAPGFIAEALRPREDTEDPTLLAEFFTLPPDPSKVAVKSRDSKPGDNLSTKKRQAPTDLPASPLRIRRIQGGFVALPVNDDDIAGLCVLVEVAYDTRRGSALGKYREEDFDLASEAFTIEPNGLNILECKGNRLRFTTAAASFALTVSGFDERRDLFVRATVEGTDDPAI